MVTVDEMRDKLLTLDTVRERLAQYEPLSEVSFPHSGPDNAVLRFDLEDGWFDPEADGLTPIEGSVTKGGVEYRLTTDALLEATSKIGLPKRYVERTPAEYIVPHLNFWYANGKDEGKMLVQEDRIVAFTKASVQPFSNLRFVEEALNSFTEAYGEGEVLVDYKFRHDLRGTSIRLVVPEQRRAMRPGDDWSAGIQIQNSLIGESSTSLSGYLFRWWCTNGCISTLASSGKWNRKHSGQGEEVYEWARQSVDEILGGLEGEFDRIQATTNAPVDGGATEMLSSIFERYNVPVQSRSHIIDGMVDSDDLTVYGVQQAITAAANRDGISDNIRTTLMTIGGYVPMDHANRVLVLEPQSAIDVHADTVDVRVGDSDESITARVRRIHND